MDSYHSIILPDSLVLVTGAAGFIGSHVTKRLVERGYRNLRCFARPTARVAELEALQQSYGGSAGVDIFKGNLLSPEDCRRALKDVALVYHLAAGRGEKLVADAFMNSVVTTRNLLDACHAAGTVKRFVNVSSFSVYTNCDKPRRSLLDERCPTERHPERRGDAYTFAKVKQDQLVVDMTSKFGIPYVIVRPGVVYGQGNERIHGRVGVGTFGLFLHLGGGNQVPLTYVDNCAEAIVLAGLMPGIEGEAFNVVDDDLPSSRRFLRLYKKHVRNFNSIYLPHALSYLFCYIWEKYSAWSEGQLPPAYTRAGWHVYWKRTRYTNEKLKKRLGWKPVVPTAEALDRYFASCKQKVLSA